MQVENDSITTSVKLFERGQLKAFVDVTLQLPFGELTILGFRVIQNGSSAPWVAYPSVSYEKAGKTVNKSIVEASRAVQAILAKTVLEAYFAATSAA